MSMCALSGPVNRAPGLGPKTVAGGAEILHAHPVFCPALRLFMIDDRPDVRSQLVFVLALFGLNGHIAPAGHMRHITMTQKMEIDRGKNNVHITYNGVQRETQKKPSNSGHLLSDARGGQI